MLQRNDLELMVSRGIISQQDIKSLIGTDLASIVGRKLYGQVELNNTNHTKLEEKPITVPFVSLMAGALLAGELIKEMCGLENSWEENKYRVDMLNVPTNYTYRLWATRNMNNQCVCKNSFRIKKYNKLWAGIDITT